jgi:CBS domain containing-hemolysin-like protein
VTQSLILWLTGLLFALDFLLILAACSLRGFSRSRLDEVCSRLNRQFRFGLILKKRKDAVLALEWLIVLVTLTATVLLVGLRNPSWQTLPAGAMSWLWIAAEALLLVGTYLAILFVLPWCTARIFGEGFLCRSWPLIALLIKISRPVLAVLAQIGKFTHRLSGREQESAEDGFPMTEEIRAVVEEGQREGMVESAAGTMIRRVMELQTEDSANVMTPRTDMFCISADATLEVARRQLLDAGHTRVPVIGKSTDDIVGILYAKDLLKYLDSANGTSVSLRDIVKEPFYVPETIGIDTLLENMKREHVHMAIVLDEYGGVVGLVTMEDILEEIVGEIADEYDTEEEVGIKPIGPNVIEVDARVHIDDLNEQFSFDLPEDDDYDTIGGFVFTQLARVPLPGDQFQWQKLRVTVLDADKRSIKRLQIEIDESLVTSTEEN